MRAPTEPHMCGSGRRHMWRRRPNMMNNVMSDEPAYHLLLYPDEVDVTGAALRLLIADETRQQDIRRLAREVLDGLEGERDEQGRLTLELSPEQMKITHSALRLLFDDLQREQASERDTLRRVLDKLPDEHTMRAIVLE